MESEQLFTQNVRGHTQISAYIHMYDGTQSAYNAPQLKFSAWKYRRTIAHRPLFVSKYSRGSRCISTVPRRDIYCTYFHRRQLVQVTLYGRSNHMLLTLPMQTRTSIPVAFDAKMQHQPFRVDAEIFFGDGDAPNSPYNTKINNLLKLQRR